MCDLITNLRILNDWIKDYHIIFADKSQSRYYLFRDRSNSLVRKTHVRRRLCQQFFVPCFIASHFSFFHLQNISEYDDVLCLFHNESFSRRFVQTGRDGSNRETEMNCNLSKNRFFSSLNDCIDVFFFDRLFFIKNKSKMTSKIMKKFNSKI